MIYSWKCKGCGRVTDIERPVAEYDKPPKHCPVCSKDSKWVKVYNSSTPFVNLSDKGVFMDKNGNYPPRSI